MRYSGSKQHIKSLYKIPMQKYFFVSMSTYQKIQKLFNWHTVDIGTYKIFIHLLTKSVWRMRFEDS